MTTQNSQIEAQRRYRIGAETLNDMTSFRVWAPSRRTVHIVVGDERRQLEPEAEGYFSTIMRAPANACYRFQLDNDEKLYPDPASRYQPMGPHGPSQIVDPRAYQWRNNKWRGSSLKGQVIYEMHVGTFSETGTWTGAGAKLPLLADAGITLIEMMPVSDFPGRFGWGYDGVNLFAPCRLYGSPDDLRHFIDDAHQHNIGVILDIVYNHIGPDGNYLPQFSDHWFTKRYKNEWGDALNFDGPHAQAVRNFFIENAEYWIEEFRFDGLRLDATQSIHDSSSEHILAEIVRAARKAAADREIILIAESEPMDTRLTRPPEDGGYGLDAIWNDDLHHSALVAMTGRTEAYFEDHQGAPQEFISAVKYGALYQGQFYAHQGKTRGCAGLNAAPAAFVNYLENHDQIANTHLGRRFHQRTSPGRARAMTTLLLLAPGTPMLFQGQEFWSRTPFDYFADHEPELSARVREGRQSFLRQFPSLNAEAISQALRAPGDLRTFADCRLDWSERNRNNEALSLHRDLLALRREDPIFAAQCYGAIDGAVIGPEAFLLRYFGERGDDRLLVVNLGRDLTPRSLAEPLAAPPHGRRWGEIFSSENPAYGGGGSPIFENSARWRIQGHTAIALAAMPASHDASLTLEAQAHR